MTARRFPPPWTVEEDATGESFIVHDAKRRLHTNSASKDSVRRYGDR